MGKETSNQQKLKARVRDPEKIDDSDQKCIL